MDKGRNTKSRWRAVTALVVGALVLSALAASPALAAKGGQVQRTGNEKCWVDPNPVADGQRYTVWGSGFTPGQALSIFVGSGSIMMATVDSLGVFSTWDWALFRDPATVSVTIYQQSDSRHRTVLASCSFQASGR